MYGFAERIEENKEKGRNPPPPKKKLINIRERQKFFEIGEAELQLCSAWCMVMLARRKIRQTIKVTERKYIACRMESRNYILLNEPAQRNWSGV